MFRMKNLNFVPKDLRKAAYFKYVSKAPKASITWLVSTPDGAELPPTQVRMGQVTSWNFPKSAFIEDPSDRTILNRGSSP
jgi:hypothetical protein